MRKTLALLLLLLLAVLPLGGLAQGAADIPADAEGPFITLVYYEAEEVNIQARAWGGTLAVRVKDWANVIAVPGVHDASVFAKETPANEGMNEDALKAVAYPARKVSLDLQDSAGALVLGAHVSNADIGDRAWLTVLGNGAVDQLNLLNDASALLAGGEYAKEGTDWAEMDLGMIFEVNGMRAWISMYIPTQRVGDYVIPDYDETAQAKTDEEKAGGAQAADASILCSVGGIYAQNNAGLTLYGPVEAKSVRMRNMSTLLADKAEGMPHGPIIGGLAMEHTTDGAIFSGSLQKITIGGSASLSLLDGSWVERMYASNKSVIHLGDDVRIETIIHSGDSAIFGMSPDQNISMQ